MIENAVDRLYALLVQGSYREAEALTEGQRLSAQEISQAFLDYGRTLAAYPLDRRLDVVEIAGASPRSWSVVAPVYTIEEGLSDLTLEITVTAGDTGPRTQIDNIRVR